MNGRLLLLRLTGCLASHGHAQNFDKGKETDSTRADCHDEFGQGGSRGDQTSQHIQPSGGPRAATLAAQLKSLRARKRPSIPGS